MLRALLTVLEAEISNPEPIFILSPTAVVHTYCRNHGDCGENYVVKSYIDLLETNALEQLKENLLIRANREKVCNSKIYFLYFKLIFIPNFNFAGDNFTSRYRKHWFNDKSFPLHIARLH